MNKSKLPSMLERIQTCQFCGHELLVSALSFAENPFCSICFVERQREATKKARYLAWKEVGEYLVLTDLAGQTPQ